MLKTYIEAHPWKIIERGWNAANHPKSESLFSIGNGRMGQRANFEETYTGKSLQGSYIAGVYYPDKTRVGWWKNGYPEYFAKVLNSCNWIGIKIKIGEEELDLNTAVAVNNFYRELDMRSGLLKRSFEATLPSGKILAIHAERFTSIAQDEIGAISYRITPLNFSGEIEVCTYLDFHVTNEDSNYNEVFWEHASFGSSNNAKHIHAKTKKTAFEVSVAMCNTFYKNDVLENCKSVSDLRKFWASETVRLNVSKGQELRLEKIVSVLSSMNHGPKQLVENSTRIVARANASGYQKLQSEHIKAWHKKWETSDIEIDGDIKAQQGIRFNIFHLNQTFTGVDSRLNIGPKGFTGEKYGGSTYWDTEAYCLPFYLATAQPKVAKNLCLYRYKHLDKAIENAVKLGFTGGAALYPMVTMNGEECHNEWEITFEEIHRNSAIAYGVFDYIRHTKDWGYLAEGGFEVLLGISRFWSQRVNWSNQKEAYVILGVTGPNEYENNINNNWYTNRMASWTLEWTMKAYNWLNENAEGALKTLIKRTSLDTTNEFAKWNDIITKLYYPKCKKLGIMLQQDGFLDKEQLTTKDLNPAERPINQHWSWDRILRSVFIKQADVLQGYYFLNHLYDQEEVKRNFDYYEPKTVHESSLSPCVHAILAAQIGYPEKAYEMYLRTSRLDIDDYNREVQEGLHITSMAGTWMSIVHGFGGMKIRNEELHFTPKLPAQWKGLTFSILWRGSALKANLTNEGVSIKNMKGASVKFFIDGKSYYVSEGERVNAPTIHI